MFLIAGILLLSIIYLLAAEALNVGSELPFKIVEGKVTSDICNLPDQASPSEFNNAMNHCVNEQRRNALDNLLSRSLLALLGLAVIAFAFGYAMAGRVLSPLAGSPAPHARWRAPTCPAGSSWTARTTS
jgi:hypothetical protein